VTWGNDKSPDGGRMSASCVGDRQQQHARLVHNPTSSALCVVLPGWPEIWLRW
jgi:hypothetical protein